MKYIWNILYYVIILTCLILAIVEFFPAFIWCVTSWGHLVLYRWMFYGIVAYFIIRRFNFFKKNELLFQTASHEISHLLVAVMLGHKIHSLQVNIDNGVVWHSGHKFGDRAIGLAPYCFPIFTYIFLLLRIIGANSMLHVFDLFIGFTLAFHITCFWNQTRLYQPDINTRGIVKSLLFIATFWFFNATVVLLSIRKGIVNTILYLFPEYWKDIVSFWNWMF